jgi:hypothetical protein
MGFPHARQRARKTNQETTGMLSYALIRTRQLGQVLGGADNDMPAGTR